MAKENNNKAKPVKGTNFYHDDKKKKRTNLLKGGKPIRNDKGKIVKAAELQSRLASGTVARVESNRKWFENTRVVGQKELESFRTAISVKKDDPYSFLLRQSKLPMSLLTDPEKVRMIFVYNLIMNLMTKNRLQE